MIITRTPFRISFFGGGTDYPVWYRDNGGSVLSTTINRYCHISCRYLPPFFNFKYLLRYYLREEAQDISEIKHPSIRECLKFLKINKGIEMVHTGDVPARSGIGSSSAFTVGLLNALYALTGKMITKRQLALRAINVEQNLLKENVGSQDQVAAAFGGFNKIELGGDNEFFVHPITISQEKIDYLQRCLMFFFTGLSRNASTIAGEQIKNTVQKNKELKDMRNMVDDAINVLDGNIDNYNDFGKLLHETWKIKRSLSSAVSSSKIDEIYRVAQNAGAIGGKICGAGGGGFMLLFAPPEVQPKIKERLKGLVYVPIYFEKLGSHVVLYSTQDE
jgi:D-glycero-alpha-D-manno-heptose-7-phosphate kinase